MRRRIAIPLLMLMLAGCASAGGKETSSSPTPKRDRNLITADEIDGSQQTTAYTLVQALRPNMLVTRGSTSITQTDPGVVVFLDGQRFGSVESLKSLQPGNLAEIRYLSASEAQSRYGVGYPQGVILVTSKKGR